MTSFRCLAGALLAPASLIVLVSCGGHGGGSSSPPPPPPAPPSAQTIAFASAGPIAKKYGDAVFTNAASGGAGGGAITYSSSVLDVATVNVTTGEVTILASGTAIITANKAADAAYLAASATYTLQVATAAQTLSFANNGPIPKSFGDAPFGNVAGGAGTGAVSYSSSNVAVATVDTNTGVVNLIGTGSAVITASKATDSRYAAASASYTVQVAPALQVIGFPVGPVSKIFGDAAFANLVSGGAGTGAISYSSSDPTVATVEANTGLVSIVAAGGTQIRATKAADANFLAAQATYMLSVARLSQSVSFADPGPIARTYGDAAFTNAVLPTGGSGALSFATGNAGVATVHSNSGLVTIVGAGDVEITASKAGDANREPAQASYSITVARAPQTISFADAGPVNRFVEDAAFANPASGGAGNGAISYASSELLVGAVDGAGLVTFGLEGTATITATKAASANHLATQASYVLNVLSRPSAPFTAWLNLNDPAQVTLPAAAVGRNFVRALSSNCAGPLSTSCVPASSNNVTTPEVTDSVAGLGRTAQYWLQNGGFSGRPMSVDARRFEGALMTPVELDDQLWMIGDRGAEIWSSSDGRAWVERSASLPWTSRFGGSLVKFNSRLYFLGGRTPSTTTSFNDVWASDDGLNWTLVLAQAPFAVREDAEVVVHDGRLWLIGGYNIDGDLRYNDVWSSSDGVSWTQATANAAFAPRHNHRVVSMNGRMWLVGGSGTQYDATTFGDVWSSADGVSWRAEPVPPFGARRRAATLVYRNRWYVAAGTDGLATNFGDVWWTEDGLQWHQEILTHSFGGRVNAYLIPYRGRVWLLGGFGSLRGTHDFYSTADFRDWRFEHTSAPFPPARPGRLVSFNGKLWMIAVATNGPMNVWWSVDGNEWTRSSGDWAIPPRTGFTVAVNNGRLWIQGGFRGQNPGNTLNDVWSTADGETWTQATDNAPFEPRTEHEMFAMNGKLFVVGGEVPGAGQRGDVWSSTDGASWTQETAVAAFGQHSGHQIVVFNGKAWLLGGRDVNRFTPGTIWSSFDGVNWTLEGTHQPATGRSHYRAVVHDSRIWITGGEPGGSFVPLGDTWYSSDGVTWTQQLAGSPAYSPREDHGFASHGGKLWIYGGEGVGGETDSHDLFWSLEGTDWRYRHHNFIEVP